MRYEKPSESEDAWGLSLSKKPIKSYKKFLLVEKE